jgi:hypothetical protein
MAGCTDKGVAPTRPQVNLTYVATFDSISITDDVLLQIVYSTFKLPSGFYQENLADTNIYYENTVSILPLARRTDRWSEMSTDDRAQAFAWSESSSVNSAYYRTLVYESQTEKFFQFCRVYLQRPRDVLFSRVHKLSYLDRSMFDAFHPTSLIGVFNFRPIDTTSVRTLVEYLWFTHNYSNGSAKALAAPTSESPDSVWCALYLVETSYGDFGLRDGIGLSRELYAIDRQTGKIYRSKSVIRSLQGRLN